MTAPRNDRYQFKSILAKTEPSTHDSTVWTYMEQHRVDVYGPRLIATTRLLRTE
jgi:hypothetical protein